MDKLAFGLIAILNAVFPFYMIYTAIDNNLFNAPFKFVMVFLLIWFLIIIASFFSFNIWWNRKNKIENLIKDDDSFIATPVFAHFIQTFGEYAGTYIAIVGSLGALFASMFLSGRDGYQLSRQIGINLKDHTTALIYPGVSSYVGGDIIAGVMGAGMYMAEELTLFIDIGTNAEIVIGNKEWFACAACSAGPAFEGGGIKFGMRAAKGAIENFSINPTTFEPMILTIGDVKPKGICGSGLITIIAEMFLAGIIDGVGKFDKTLNTKKIPAPL